MNQATVVLAVTLLSSVMVMLDEVVCVTALETPFPATARCIVANTALPEVSATPVTVTLECPAVTVATQERAKCAFPATHSAVAALPAPEKTPIPPVALALPRTPLPLVATPYTPVPDSEAPLTPVPVPATL